MRLITLLTDFGSFYPAQVKGVILSKIRDVMFVDIAHDIPPQDITAGAFALLASVKHFPAGTIHIAVVDPLVGAERRGIVVKSGEHLFIGPDNGLLMPAAKSIGEPVCYEIAGKFEAAPTFHGRDIFAPAAAMLAEGCSPQSMGPRIDPIDLDFGAPNRLRNGIEAAVIYIDRFGNLILNMKEIPKFCLSLKGQRLRHGRTYAEAEMIEPLIIHGSHGFVEVAINRGNAAQTFGQKVGDRVILEEIDCLE